MTNMWLNCPDNILDYFGIIYRITNVPEQKFYIGKKNLWKTLKRKPLKGRVNKRHERVQTDWLNYWSSSEYVHRDIERLGKDAFTREIIALATNKTELNYLEAYYILAEQALLKDSYYNYCLSCDIYSQHLPAHYKI